MKKIVNYVEVSNSGLILEIEFLTAFFSLTIIPGLDHPISSLNIEGRRFIAQRLNDKYYDGKQFV